LRGPPARVTIGRDVSDALWKRLVDDLRAPPEAKPHLDRVRQRIPAGVPRDDLAREVLQEMASALGRSQRKVSAALERAARCAEAIDALSTASERGRPAWRREMNSLIEAFNSERAAAVKSLWELKVHREAIGLRRHDGLDDEYPIPEARPRV
jgi:hypothetical protein